MKSTSTRAISRVLLLAALTTMAWPARAQQAQFERVEVSLWPEYDRPAVLVIYRVTLSAGFALPGTVRLRIPAAAGQPNAVAEAEDGGNLLTSQYERTVDGDWALLTISVNHPRFQVEYYDVGIERDGDRRSFRFHWPGEHAVRTFVVDVQEPVGTTEMTTEPSSSAGVGGADGLMHRTLDLGAVPLGEERVVELDYTRDSNALSADVLPSSQPAPSPSTNPAPAPSSGSAQPSSWHQLVAGILAALLAGAVAYWFLFLRGGAAADGDQPATSRGGKRGAGKGGVRYCSSCGAQVSGDDRFCAGCGKKLA